MRDRCSNANRKDFKYYGGRGIKVCKRWQKFENFLADMGEPPANATIDRKNNDGDYKPSNCRWATRKEQTYNSRAVLRITHNGRTQNLKQWAAELGISLWTYYRRRHAGASVLVSLGMTKS